MDLKARSELGDILTDIEVLLDILAKNPSALEAYPNLQSHLVNRRPKSTELRGAISDNA